jgi:hypothetical protein
MEIDAERRAELLRWAEALDRSDTAELRAAGRAIRVLCDENEELRRRLAALENREPPDAPGLGPDGGASATGDAARKRPRFGGFGGLGRTERRFAAVAGVAVLFGGLVVLAARAATPGLAVTGPPNRATIGADALAALAFESTAKGTSWELDGQAVTPTQLGARFSFRPPKLDDGPHRLVVRKDGPLFLDAERSFAFVVDTEAPELQLDRPAVAAAGQALALAGELEPGATLATAAGRPVPLDEGGRFAVRFAEPPRRVTLVATDTAGNSSRWLVPVTVAPRRPKQPVRAVHVTAYGWANDALRAGVLELIRQGRINAVELDLKDEAGEIGWNPPVRLARQMGASLDIYA